MSDQKISALLTLSLLSAPIALPASAPSYNHIKSSPTISSEDTFSSQRASVRRMKLLLAAPPMLQPASTSVSAFQ